MTHPQIFRDVRNYVSTTYGITSQSHAANHHRLLSHVTLCLIECSKQNSSCHVRTLKQNLNHTLEVKGQGHSRPVVVKASTLTLVKFHHLVSKNIVCMAKLYSSNRYTWTTCVAHTDVLLYWHTYSWWSRWTPATTRYYASSARHAACWPAAPSP